MKLICKILFYFLFYFLFFCKFELRKKINTYIRVHLYKFFLLIYSSSESLIGCSKILGQLITFINVI